MRGVSFRVGDTGLKIKGPELGEKERGVEDG